MARHLAIGDIHGCFAALQALSKVVRFRDDDIIIALGDYSSRGPNTNAVLDWLIRIGQQHNLKTLRGNHEVMLVNARGSRADYEQWLAAGGEATLRSYAPCDGDPGRLADIPAAHWELLDHRLLPYFETDTHFFVHANAYPDLPLDEQPDFMLYWEKYHDPPPHCSGKVMVCGHTPQKSGLPATNGHAICIDTWACGGQWLSCLDVESGRVWQANECGQTRTLWLDALPQDTAG